jgi:hypothetical protein
MSFLFVRIFRAAALVTARKTPTDGDDSLQLAFPMNLQAIDEPWSTR